MPSWHERKDEMSNRKIVDVNEITDRIGLYVSNEALRKLGWLSQPELLLEEFQQIVDNTENIAREYLGTYPLFGDRHKAYVVEVCIFKDEVEKTWTHGNVRATRSVGSMEVVYWATFTIKWNVGFPIVNISNFTKVAAS